MNDIPAVTPHLCVDEMTNCATCPEPRKTECFYKNDPDGEQKKAREAEKQRLVKLIDIAQIECDDNYGMTNSKQMADFLLENGVIVAPFMVGDKVYVVPTAQTPFKEVIEATVLRRKASTIDNYIIRYFAHLTYEIANPYLDDGTKMTCGIDAILGEWEGASWNSFYLTVKEAEAAFQKSQKEW